MNQSQIHTESGLKSNAGISVYLARIISNAANPLIIPPLIILATGLAVSMPLEELGWITLVSLIFYTLIPFSTAIYLLKSGKIESLDIPLRENRNTLFLYSIISTAFGSLTLMFLYFGRSMFITEIAVVFLLNPVIGFFINRKFKISIHAGAVAMAGTLLLTLFQQLPGPVAWLGILSLTVLLVLLPAMIWSRYRLRVHSFPELIGGAAAGIFITLLEISIIQTIW
jgi:membrane-associated phospholipid phosphatase